MVPTLQCGLFLSNFSFAISVSSSGAKAPNLLCRDWHGLSHALIQPKTLSFRTASAVRNLLFCRPCGTQSALFRLPRTYVLGYLYAAPSGLGPGLPHGPDLPNDPDLPNFQRSWSSNVSGDYFPPWALPMISSATERGTSS